MVRWSGGQFRYCRWTVGQVDKWIEYKGAQVMLNKQRDVMARKVYLLLAALVNLTAKPSGKLATIITWPLVKDSAAGLNTRKNATRRQYRGTK